MQGREAHEQALNYASTSTINQVRLSQQIDLLK